MKSNGSGIGLWLKDADTMTYTVLKAVTHEEQLWNQVERARLLGFKRDRNDGERLLVGCEVHVLSLGESETCGDFPLHRDFRARFPDNPVKVTTQVKVHPPSNQTPAAKKAQCHCH
jgi:hypothetical protein